MNCPKCNCKTRVTDVAHTDNNETYRRKRCSECGHVFFTIEFEADKDDAFWEDWQKFNRSYIKRRQEREEKFRNEKHI